MKHAQQKHLKTQALNKTSFQTKKFVSFRSNNGTSPLAVSAPFRHHLAKTCCGSPLYLSPEIVNQEPQLGRELFSRAEPFLGRLFEKPI